MSNKPNRKAYAKNESSPDQKDIQARADQEIRTLHMNAAIAASNIAKNKKELFEIATDILEWTIYYGGSKAIFKKNKAKGEKITKEKE